MDWVTHALWPALAWLGIMSLLHVARVDAVSADWFWQASGGRWRFEEGGLAHLVFYRGGRALVIGAAALSLTLVVGSIFAPPLRRWRRPASYLLTCIALTTGLASLGKQVTNVDCPRVLERYGGDRPQLGLFDDRPHALPRARCFPGGHSSGGFSFLALYFLLGERRRRQRWLGQAAGLALGSAFAFVQWGRGMHFPSHDLVSAAIAWLVALSAYTVVYRNSVWETPRSGRDAPAVD